MSLKKIMSLNEFLMAEPKTTPRTPVAPPQEPATRPSRPIPTVRPGEKEKGKPLASAEEVLDQFFTLLAKEKDTRFGKRTIKKLHDKYAK
jgi:hypothetical protein